MHKTLNEWLAWQQALHPLEIDLGLDRVRSVAQRLDVLNPKASVIVVAGTNGKGSSVAMLASIYRAAGYRVGTYTSPHLLHYNERIRINGQTVENSQICLAFKAIDHERNDVSLSYFEFGTLAALKILGDSDLDIVILEIGLGGRLDAVNLVDSDVALITSIGFDHQAWLGADIASIAAEKAGIMRRGRPVVINTDAAKDTLVNCAKDSGAVARVLDIDYQYQRGTKCWSWRDANRNTELAYPELNGDHQLQNAAGVVAVVDALADRFPISTDNINFGLRNTKLGGRFQKLGDKPTRIVDVAHNIEASRALVNNIQSQQHAGKIRMVFSMLADKDVAAVMRELAPIVDDWYIAPVNSNKSVQLKDMREQFRAHTGSRWHEFDTIESAWNAAIFDANSSDAVIATGSFHVVSEVLSAESAKRIHVQHGNNEQATH